MLSLIMLILKQIIPALTLPGCNFAVISKSQKMELEGSLGVYMGAKNSPSHAWEVEVPCVDLQQWQMHNLPPKSMPEHP